MTASAGGAILVALAVIATGQLPDPGMPIDRTTEETKNMIEGN